MNVVAPGAIETDFGGGAIRDNAQINALIASLLSDDNRWINAQRIEVSGGVLI
ncbi:MAG: hypothetical protein ACH34X_14070 [Thiolinea sp.]